MATPLKIYVASSWRNAYYPQVVDALTKFGYDVYDFRKEGFGWSQLGQPINTDLIPSDQKWKRYFNSIPQYIELLNNPIAKDGFNRDMDALKAADICIYVMPCGVSASLELGYAVGAGKKTVAYIPDMHDCELMLKMVDLISPDFTDVLNYVNNLNYLRSKQK